MARALSPLKHLHTLHLERSFDRSNHDQIGLKFASRIPTLRFFAVKQHQAANLDHYYVDRSCGDGQVNIIPENLSLEMTRVPGNTGWGAV
jgi:hypothetical protein